MISKVSNTPNFGSAHLNYKPKAIVPRHITSDVPELPVLDLLTKITEDPQKNWHVSTGTYETQIKPSEKTGFIIPERANNLIKALIGDEEYVLFKDNKATESSFVKLFNTLKTGLKK